MNASRTARSKPYVEATLDRDDPRTWFFALMDYGSALKRREPNPGRRSTAYSRQSRFEGSHRQVRSAVLHSLTSRGPMRGRELRETVAESVGRYGEAPDFESRVCRAVAELSNEGFLEVKDGSIRLKN